MITCKKCILSSVDDPNLKLDNNGVCNHCHAYDENILKHYYGNEEELSSFHGIIKKIKEECKTKKYDVLIGLSGGVDSSYMAYLCVQHNLRALVFHLDNGWNSELSVVNIKNILKKTGFDLYTYVINWNEFRDLQRSYFRANVVDIEALTDHAISSVMLDTAVRNNIKYVLSGSSITTEGRLPEHWVHNKSDAMNIKDIQRRFGTLPIKTFPIKGMVKRRRLKKKHGIKIINILDYIPYDKPKAKEIIIEQFKWRDYGGKHYESVFTRFYQAYILPKKFNIDKRKSHYSTLICAGQMTREEALSEMQKPTYTTPFLERADKEYVIKKLGFTVSEFDEYMSTARIEHTHYRSSQKFLNMMSIIKRTLLFRK